MDCVFNTGRRCSALVDKKCERCNFAKTAEQLNIGRQCAIKRIKSLPEQQRKYISEKYYYRKFC